MQKRQEAIRHLGNHTERKDPEQSMQEAPAAGTVTKATPEPRVQVRLRLYPEGDGSLEEFQTDK